MKRRVQQSEKELLGKLREQITLLRSSADAYDRGVEVEALDLAVRLRVLLHNTSCSRSLLGQLGRNQIDFYDSATMHRFENAVGLWGLTLIRMSTQEGVRHVAPLDSDWGSWRDRKVAFGEWWHTQIVVADERGRYTRRDLILNVANADGGAHVDPRLREDYAHLSRHSTLGLRVLRNGVECDFENRPVLASIRQIAHEVLKTLRDEFPDM